MKAIFFLMIISIALFANIGKITFVKGSAFIQRGEVKLNVHKNFLLEIKDIIITKKKSKVLILFNDKTHVTVGKNSTFKIEDFFENPIEPKKSKLTFKLGKGIFRTISGKIGKMNRKGFVLKTKSASIGIRGSDGTTIVNALGNVKHLTTNGAFILKDNVTGKLVDIVKGSTGVFSPKGLVVAITSKLDLAEVFNLSGEKSWFEIPKELKKKKPKKKKIIKQEKKPIKIIKPLDNNITKKPTENNITKIPIIDNNITKVSIDKNTTKKIKKHKRVIPKLKPIKGLYDKDEISLKNSKKTNNISTHTVDIKEVLLKVQNKIEKINFKSLQIGSKSAIKHKKRVSNIQQNIKNLALFRTQYEQNHIEIKQLEKEIEDAKKLYDKKINKIYKQNSALSRYTYLMVVAKDDEDYEKDLESFILDKYAIKKYDQTTTLKKSLATTDIQSEIKTQRDFGQKSVDIIYDYILRANNTVLKIIKIDQNPFIKSNNTKNIVQDNNDEQFADSKVYIYDIQDISSYQAIFENDLGLSFDKVEPFMKALRDNINLSTYRNDFLKNSKKITKVLKKLENQHIKQAVKIAKLQDLYQIKKDINKQIEPAMDKILRDTQKLLKPYNIKLTKETIGNLSLMTPKIYSETVDYKEEVEFILRKVKSYISKINISNLKQSDTLINFSDLTSKKSNKHKMIKFDSIHILPYLDTNNKIGLLIFSAISIKDDIGEDDFIKFDFKYDSIKFVPIKKGYKTLFVAQTELTLGIVKEFLEKNSYKKYFDQYCIDESFLPEDAKNFKRVEKEFYRYPAVCFKVDKISKFIKWVSQKTKREIIIPKVADWSYVASNMDTTNYCWGDETIDDLLEEEMKPENIYLDEHQEISTIQKVASYPKSKSNIYDMCGNVFELTKEDGELTYKGNSFSSYIEQSNGESEEYADDINPALGIRLFYVKDLKNE